MPVDRYKALQKIYLYKEAMLTEELKNRLHACGAALVGFADMSEVAVSSLPMGVCVAIPLSVDIVREAERGPTLAYWQVYNELNARLNKIREQGPHFSRHRAIRRFRLGQGRSGRMSSVEHLFPIRRSPRGREWAGPEK